MADGKVSKGEERELWLINRGVILNWLIDI